MPEQSVIVWDLGTVPDTAGFAAANDLVGKSDVEVREAIGDPSCGICHSSGHFTFLLDMLPPSRPRLSALALAGVMLAPLNP